MSITKLINFGSLKSINKFCISCKYSTSAISSYLQYDKDPGPKFIDPETQKILKSITCFQLDKIFRRRPTEKQKVEYKFMTTEQVNDAVKQSIRNAKRLLQMPPIVQIKEEKVRTLSNDPGLDSFDDTKYVFTDITYGIPDNERIIVVRYPNGTLETADGTIRKRINQIYFPQPRRNIRAPRMFEIEHLTKCLDKHEYEFVLDRLCAQYEPYSQEFHDISSLVYQHINDTKQFDILRSTRHFGPMSFFFAWHKMIDDLVIDMVRREYLENAVEVVCLMYKLNNIEFDKEILNELHKYAALNDISTYDGLTIAKGNLEKNLEDTIRKSEEELKIHGICFDFMEKYVKEHGIKKSKIEICLQDFAIRSKEKRQLLVGLQTAHGIS